MRQEEGLSFGLPLPLFNPVSKQIAGFLCRFLAAFVLRLAYAPITQDCMHRSDSMPMVSIRPGYLTFYSEPLRGGSALRNQEPSKPPPERHRADGVISDKAGRRISQAIDWMLYLAKPKKLYPDRARCSLEFRLNFITLTLSSEQVHDDNIIKEKLLQPFLDTLRKTWKCTVYIWRAEPQKNGRIHFHLVTDVYIPWWTVRDRWNDIQNILGYIDRYTEVSGKVNPPSTEVRCVRKVKNLAAYFGAYFRKNPKDALYTACRMEQGSLQPCYNPSDALHIYPAAAGKYRAVGGKLWGLSYSLSKIRSAVACVHDIKDQSLHALWKLFGKDAKEYDYHTCIYIPVAQWGRQVSGDLLGVFLNYLGEYRQLQALPETHILAAAPA